MKAITPPRMAREKVKILLNPVMLASASCLRAVYSWRIMSSRLSKKSSREVAEANRDEL